MLLLERTVGLRETPASAHAPARGRFGLRGVAIILLALVLIPWYRLLAVRATGPGAEQVLRLGQQYFVAQWAGLALGTVALVVLSRIVPPSFLSHVRRAGSRWLIRPPVAWIALILGAVAAGISLGLSVLGLDRKPVLLDGISQLIQARYFAAGRLGGPPLEDPAFWQFQFMVLTDAGWASQYPPGFPALLAVGWAGGAAWLVGPLLLGLAVVLTTFVAERLFPHDRATARLGAALTAVSFFLAFHAAAYMNHALALALLALALAASLQSLDGSWRWALLSGAAVGALFATRPYVGAVLGPFATVAVWAWAPGGGRFGRRDWMARLGAVASGAAPFIVAVGAYNARLFGDPTRFGYAAAAGPAHGPGFHVDPWGSPYGPLEALGATSADLVGLSLDLLQTPFPVVVAVAIWLFLAARVERGVGLVVAWALLPVAANALYWHHDLYMGPRLLYEAAPAWCLLVALSFLGFLRGLPEDGAGGTIGRLFTRSGVAAAFVLALTIGLALAGPAKLASYAATAERSGLTVEPPPVDRPSLVFVHEDWESRVGARLSAMGMRLDSIRAALRHNSTCEVDRFVRAWERGRAPLPSPGLAFDDGRERGLRSVRMPSGSAIRTYPGEVLTPECEREAASDYAGVVALAPLVWQGDLPGLGTRGAMFVRDLGPERNAALIVRLAHREPRVLLRTGGETPRLMPYEQGMEALWPAAEAGQGPPGGRPGR